MKYKLIQRMWQHQKMTPNAANQIILSSANHYPFDLQAHCKPNLLSLNIILWILNPVFRSLSLPAGWWWNMSWEIKAWLPVSPMLKKKKKPVSAFHLKHIPIGLQLNPCPSFCTLWNVSSYVSRILSATWVLLPR